MGQPHAELIVHAVDLAAVRQPERILENGVFVLQNAIGRSWQAGNVRRSGVWNPTRNTLNILSRAACAQVFTRQRGQNFERSFCAIRCAKP
jgi:hypothetical protein